MKKFSFMLVAFLAALASFAFNAEAAAKKAVGTKPSTELHDVTIFFANDVRGETEPCG